MRQQVSTVVLVPCAKMGKRLQVVGKAGQREVNQKEEGWDQVMVVRVGEGWVKWG
jgi:hypothetical protein